MSACDIIVDRRNSTAAIILKLDCACGTFAGKIISRSKIETMIGSGKFGRVAKGAHSCALYVGEE
jgi:hypothetical protein